VKVPAIPPKSIALVLPLDLGVRTGNLPRVSAWVRQSLGWATLMTTLNGLDYFRKRKEKFAGCIGFFRITATMPWPWKPPAGW
jgi:hypothetical protein